MKTKGFRLKMAVFYCALVLAGFRASAATISGTVSDTEGAGLPGAQLTARQVESDFSLTVVTKEDGGYALESLPPGTYTITIQKAGYADWTEQNVRAESDGETLRLHFRLRSSEGQTVVRGEEELNPNVFVLKLDTNEILRELRRRGANADFSREFRSEQNYFGAIYGHPLRSVDWLKPRAPLRSFHGSLYESHQNSVLNARTFFTVGRFKPSRRNQYGFAVNGSLLREKLSFSGAWSQARETGFVNGNIQIPLPEERAPRSTDPALRPVIQRLLEAYPNEVPNLTPISPRLHNTNAVREINNTAFSTRFDYRPRETGQLALEQRFLDDTEEPFEMVIGQNPLSLLRPQSYHLTYLHTAAPGTLWRFSYHFDRLGASFDITESYRNLVGPLGYDPAPNFSPGDFTGLGPGPDYPFQRVENRFYFSPEITHSRGRHTIAAGAVFNRIQFNDSLSEGVRGGFSFTRDRPEGGEGPERAAFENFLLGLPSSYEIGLGNAYRGFRHWEQAFYFQDTFRLHPYWTLSLGLRYEVITPPVEVNDRTPIVFGADANNFAPQFGFAWNPGGGRTVVRGGYGITFGTIHPLLYQRARFNPPDLRLVQVTKNVNLLEPLRDVQITVGGKERSELKMMSPDLVAPYSHVYTLQIQRTLPANFTLSVGYGGERTIKLPNRIVFNRAQFVPGIPVETGTINDRRPNPDFLQITTVVNGTISYYDALNVALNRRLARGMALNVRYTFSKSLSTGDTTFAEIETGANVTQSSELVSDMKAVTKFDTPHALTIGYSYEWPALRSQPVPVSLLFGRWRISGTTTMKSGTPLAIHTGSDSPRFGNVDGVRGSDRPNLLDPSILGKSMDHPDTSRSVLAVDTCERPTASRPYMQCQYFDTNLPPGGRGNIGFNTFRSDGVHNWNVALEKEFPFREASASSPHLLFRSEFINFFNQPQFAEPNLRMASETFGYITNTANRGRIIQLLLRLRW